MRCMETWPRAERDLARDRMVVFAQTAVAGRASVPGDSRWADLKELVATSAERWEPSSAPR